MQYDVELIHDIEELVGKKLEEYKVDEDKVLKGITKVCLLFEDEGLRVPFRLE